MQRLAVLAVLLTLCAPLPSRWVQAHGPLSVPAGPATAVGRTASAAVDAAMPGHDHAHRTMPGNAGAVPAAAGAMHRHAGGAALPAAADDIDMPAAHHSQGQGGNGHAAHGEACDYCVLAARLLPALAVAWLLLPPLHPPLPLVRRLLPVFAPVLRRAHAPRGPPLAA